MAVPRNACWFSALLESYKVTWRVSGRANICSLMSLVFFRAVQIILLSFSCASSSSRDSLLLMRWKLLFLGTLSFSRITLCLERHLPAATTLWYFSPSPAFASACCSASDPAEGRLSGNALAWKLLHRTYLLQPGRNGTVLLLCLLILISLPLCLTEILKPLFFSVLQDKTCLHFNSQVMHKWK